MAKIIKQADKFKPINCDYCGCTYEFEYTDLIDVDTLYANGKIIIQRKLQCPICKNWNKLEKENEQ